MAFKRNGYYYNQQLTTYIRQFMAIFSGLQVQVGKWNTEDERLISVPIHYASPDRVVASIIADNTQNKPLRLPLMTAYVRNIQRDLTRVAGTGTERRNTYTPVGGIVGQDTKVIHQRKPSPWVLDVDLSMYASNSDQHFQMLEQVLPLFDPLLMIQTSDGIFDMTRLTSVELKNSNIDTNYPIGTSRRIIQSTHTFSLPIWIDSPADVRSDFINKIFVRIGAVDAADITPIEIIADLDSQGIPYELWQDGSQLKLD